MTENKWSFISHITNHMAKPRFGEQKAPTLWPSGAACDIKDLNGNETFIGKCRRQSFFRYFIDTFNFYPDYDECGPFVKHIKDNTTPLDTYKYWIFKAGDLYEEYCIDVAKESGVYVADQVPIYIPAVNVSGKIDLIVIDPETSKYRIVEVKSVYGFNGNTVLGTPADRRRGALGTPREAHLMQLGIYQWWYGNCTDNFAEALLVYGDRGTGLYAEYTVTVEKSEADGLSHIYYQGNSPTITEKIDSNIILEEIMQMYQQIQGAVSSRTPPERDYDMLYSQERIKQLYDAGLLSKTDRIQYEKRAKQLEEGKTRLVKEVVKGDWQCTYCEYKNVCYDSDGVPKDLPKIET